ncbi:MAG: UDP-glucose/GDP-mannose dehydrogenase family protein [Actinobacteria bacterium]|nr:UDP-glucose/GDP-mannose dehydrogenase family protein [Actinomycetota bacterium]
MMEREPIGVIGAGWVGLVTAACFAELGHRVTVRDVVPERVAELQAGRVPIHEPGLDALLERNRERLQFTLEIEDVFRDAAVAFVCVGTPSTYSGDADLSAVSQVLEELPEFEERAILVMKSTVPVGTGEKVRHELDARGLAHVGYVANPEFLAEGTAVANFLHPDRVVVGSFAQADGDAVATLYEPLEAPVVRTDIASAEMIKLASNAFLATRISFINEIANVCEMTGADVVDVARGMGLDHRLGRHFLNAGLGYGGSCFPKDVQALKQLAGNSGYHFQLLNAVIEVNELQKRRVVAKLVKYLGPLRGRTIALLGLAFKPNTNDMREASSLVLASRLLAEGARVRAWDPVAMDEARALLRGVQLTDSLLEAVEGADAAVIVTEWDEIRDATAPEVRTAMANPLIIDGRNMLDPETVRAAGFRYEGIGRASSSLRALAEAEEREPDLQA